MSKLIIHIKVLLFALSTANFVILWQFAQFALFTQWFCVYAILTLDLIKLDVFMTIIKGYLVRSSTVT